MKSIADSDADNSDVDSEVESVIDNLDIGRLFVEGNHGPLTGRQSTVGTAGLQQTPLQDAPSSANHNPPTIAMRKH